MDGTVAMCVTKAIARVEWKIKGALASLTLCKRFDAAWSKRPKWSIFLVAILMLLLGYLRSFPNNASVAYASENNPGSRRGGSHLA